MPIGPVQIVVLGFAEPNFTGAVLAELDRLKKNDVVRLVDGMLVHKDAAGDVTIVKRSDLNKEEAEEFGAVVGALIGLGVDGFEGAAAGAAAGAEAASDGVDVFDPANHWDVIEEIPKDSAAAILMLEHRWAIPLTEAVRKTGGFHLADGWIHPEDLVELGLFVSEETKALS
jgi:uncharacterized membrane protein